MDTVAHESLVVFFCLRLADYPSLEYITTALHALLLKYPFGSDALIERALRAIFEEVRVQALPQPSRLQYMEIMHGVLQGRWSVPHAMGADFVFGFVQVMDGEKDPRCLRLSFACVQYIITGSGELVAPQRAGAAASAPLCIPLWERFVEELFEITVCYFPIMFRQPPSDAGADRVEPWQLRAHLRLCLTASDRFVDNAISVLTEKLDPVPQAAAVNMDCAQTLVWLCHARTPAALAPHMPAVADAYARVFKEMCGVLSGLPSYAEQPTLAVANEPHFGADVVERLARKANLFGLDMIEFPLRPDAQDASGVPLSAAAAQQSEEFWRSAGGAFVTLVASAGAMVDGLAEDSAAMNAFAASLASIFNEAFQAGVLALNKASIDQPMPHAGLHAVALAHVLASAVRAHHGAASTALTLALSVVGELFEKSANSPMARLLTARCAHLLARASQYAWKHAHDNGFAAQHPLQAHVATVLDIFMQSFVGVEYDVAGVLGLSGLLRCGAPKKPVLDAGQQRLAMVRLTTTLTELLQRQAAPGEVDEEAVAAARIVQAGVVAACDRYAALGDMVMEITVPALTALPGAARRAALNALCAVPAICAQRVPQLIAALDNEVAADVVACARAFTEHNKRDRQRLGGVLFGEWLPALASHAFPCLLDVSTYAMLWRCKTARELQAAYLQQLLAAQATDAAAVGERLAAVVAAYDGSHASIPLTGIFAKLRAQLLTTALAGSERARDALASLLNRLPRAAVERDFVLDELAAACVARVRNVDEQANATAGIDVLFACARALAMGGHRLATPLINDVIIAQVLDELAGANEARVALAQRAAESFALLVGGERSAEPVSTSNSLRDHHYVVKPLYKQKTFDLALPLLLERWESSDSSCYMLAMASMLTHVPPAVVEAHLTTVTPVLLKVLRVCRDDHALLLRAVDSLGAVFNQGKLERPSAVVQSLLHFCTALRDDEAHADDAIRAIELEHRSGHVPRVYPILLRIASLNLLCGVASANYQEVFPFKDAVIRALDICVDDPKRAVRRVAVKCRNEWCCISSMG